MSRQWGYLPNFLSHVYYTALKHTVSPLNYEKRPTRFLKLTHMHERKERQKQEEPETTFKDFFLDV